MEPSRRFVKRIPPSGVAPAFKLSLPQNVVYAHLGHWVGRPFELAATKDADQTWTGSIVPRRNKERAEFTLKGWKLFAEAHSIKTGDQYSFEIVSETRLVISLLAGNIHTGNVSPPLAQPDPQRCGVVGIQTWAAGQHSQPESGLTLSVSRSSLESHMSEAQAAQAAKLLTETFEPSTPGAFAASQAAASPMMLDSGLDAHGAEKYRESQAPSSPSVANHKLQAGCEWGAMAHSQKGPSSPSSSSLLSCLEFDPLMPVVPHSSGQADLLQAMHNSAADASVDWLADLGGDASMPPAWLQRPDSRPMGDQVSGPSAGPDYRLKRLRSDSKAGTDNAWAVPAEIRSFSLPAGISQAQVREDQAARAEQLRLKQFMLETRDSQQGMLNAVAMLERLSKRLVAYSAGSNPPSPSRGFTVQNIQAEMLGCMDTIKTGIWKFLSTDV